MKALAGPVMLVEGERIAQVKFSWVDQPVKHPYGSKAAGSHYQGQRGPTPSWRCAKVDTHR
jgi:dCTP deaminase